MNYYLMLFYVVASYWVSSVGLWIMFFYLGKGFNGKYLVKIKTTILKIKNFFFFRIWTDLVIGLMIIMLGYLIIHQEAEVLYDVIKWVLENFWVGGIYAYLASHLIVEILYYFCRNYLKNN